MSTDLSINGPGSPVSLQKFLDNHEGELREITLLIDGSGNGIAHDSASCLYITPAECSTQALYYTKTLFDGIHVPAYLYRYLHYMFLSEDRTFLYPTDESLIKANVDPQSTDYQHIVNLLKNAEHNPEAQQVIGLIQLSGGSLNMAAKQNNSIRLYIQHPETHLHPKRQSMFVTMLMHLKDDYSKVTVNVNLTI